MKPEINAATEFLSRIFLAHENIPKEKVVEFKQQLSELLEERFRNHWHETCPTKGQAYRCIRVCPEEPLDPILEKVCAGVGINVGDFNLPFELTLWVDPTEVVCKFGDLKCSYHIVAKKDNTSGNLNSQTDKLDIEDLVENARDLYLKKQTIVIHPIHSTEMHISNPFSDGSAHCITMAIRVNGTMHYQMSGSPPPVYDGSPQFKGKHSHTTHKHGGCHYYGKSSGGKGTTYLANSTTNGSGSFISSIHHGYQHHHNQQHYYNNINDSSFGYSNGYLNGYGGDENGYVFDQQSSSPPKANGSMSMPSLSSGSGALFQSSPTPEQIQQQLQHPPPIPSSISHPQQAFSHPSPNVTALPPQHPPPPSSNSNSGSSSAVGAGKANSNGSSSKHHDTRGSLKQKGKQTSPAKELK